MAVDPEDNAAQENPDAAASKRLIMIVGAVLALLLVIVVVVFFIFVADRESSEQSDGQDTVVVAENINKAFYVAMPQAFIFNVPGAQQDRMAQIGVQLLVRGTHNEALVEQNIPLLEATLLDVFSRTTAERLTSSQGKRELRVLALEAVRLAMQEVHDGEPVVEQVLFTGFVLQ